DDLAVSGDLATCRGRHVDLIYNRLTDFYFEAPKYALLRDAYLRNLVVVTPHPRAHALYANKRNLALLSDAPTLQSIGASTRDIEVLLRGIPRTLAIEGSEERWWRERKGWFFKPSHGYGSKGT